MSVVIRPERVPFRIHGPDATRLLHDVLTPTVEDNDGPARWFALLTPQGKIIAEGLIGWAEDAYWLDLHKDVAEAFMKRMRLYRLRAKLEIEDLGETHAVGWSQEDAAGPGLVHRDGRAEGLGHRVIAPRADAASWVADDAPERARIAAGIAELGADFPTEDAYPHDLGMDLVGGVDFKKGCFVGQEVVSRMQHRGTARRRPVIVSGLAADAGGETVGVAGKSAGVLGRVVDGSAVALLRIDRIGDPDAATVAGAPVSLALPAWAGYAFGESAPAG